ncbi:MAG: hypothetical protein HYV42_02915 [Candidatus Magasanikbacteria bacterium]|nr:hypothetical protein [Candidatus Magasanikbacteria bacterium]
MIAKKNIKFIIFDAYGVCLTGGYPDTCRYLAKKFNRDWQDIYAVLYTKYFNQAATKQITQQAAWAKALKELNFPLTVAAVKRIHYRLMGLNWPVLKIVQKISEKVPVLLLSKNTRSQFKDINNKFPRLRQIFGQHIINTWEYNLPKASPETLAMIFKRYHITDPATVVSIDDQDNNLVAARELGVNAILYRNFGQFKRELARLINI